MCSHSAAVTGPGLFQIEELTATRPTSWTRAARRAATISAGSRPIRAAASPASSATPAECPTRYGDTRSAKSPMAPNASSTSAPLRTSRIGSALEHLVPQ